MGPEWPSIYWNDSLKVILVIYVDAFKMAGPKGHLASCWSDLRTGLHFEPESKLGMYLGCTREKTSAIRLPDGTGANCETDNMEDFLQQCIQRHLVATSSSEK